MNSFKKIGAIVVLRDYSDEMLRKMINQICQINNEQYSWITDKLGDLCYGFSSMIGWLKIDNYLDNVEKYHKKVLDKNNTTIDELREIFKNVDIVDFEYGKKIGVVNESLVEYIDTTKKLSSMIKSDGSLKTANKDLFEKRISKTDEKLNVVFDESLKKYGKKVMKEAVKDLPGDALKVFTCMYGFMKCVAKGDLKEAGEKAWETISLPFEIGNDLSAIAMVPLTNICSDRNARYEGLKEAEARYKVSSLADELEVEEAPDEIVNVVKTVDTGIKIDKTVSGVKDVIGNAEEIGGVLSSDIFTDETKVMYLKDQLLSELGFSPTDYNGNTIIGQIKNNKNDFSNLKTAYDYIEAAANGNLGSEILGNTSIGGLGNDFDDIADSFEELGIKTSYTSDGGGIR